MPKLTGFAPIDIRGPGGPPLVGVQYNAMRLLGDPIGRSLALREMGDVVAVHDRSPALVMAFGPAFNREVLSNPSLYDNDTDIPIKIDPGSPLAILTKGLTHQQGEGHRRHRRLMMPAFQKTALDAYAADIVAVAESALAEWPVGQTADVALLTKELVQYIAVRCLFGLDWKSGDRGLGRAASETIELVTSPLVVALPFRIPGTPYAKLMAASTELVALIRQLVEEKRARGAGGTDALALMLQAAEKDDAPLADDELVGEAATLYIAGHDTQARTLAWTLFLLGQHPKVLADVLDEIDHVLDGGAPNLGHLPKLVLVDRVLKESMRVLPVVPLSFLKVAQAEARLGEHTLPRGASVILSPFITQRDPELYPEPKRFRPERWEKLSPSIYEYLPFGAGPRMCIGAGFATMAMRLVLPMILQRFRTTLAPHANVSRLVRAQILCPKHGLPMTITQQDRKLDKAGRVVGDVAEIVDFDGS